MAFRITTNGLFRNYRSNLYKTYNKLNTTMGRVETTRNFSEYYEDPAAASKAFQLRRSYWRTQDYIDNSNYLISKNQVAWSSSKDIVDGNEDMESLASLKGVLAGITDTAGTGRKALGQDLHAKADAIVMAMNAQYNGEFVFGGADGLKVPFSWDESRNLLYRGINVNAAEGTEDYAKLQEISAEKTYVDIGIGMQENEDGTILASSAFNAVINGANFLGFGLDEDGDPKNIVSLMQEASDILYRADPDTGAYANEGDKERLNVLVLKIEDAINRVEEQHVHISANSTYLQTNLTQLEETQFTLNTEIDAVEQIDPAMAIMEMMWAQYSYNAALRIGNDLLSGSLFDYMR